jgi:hypothetical protein
MQHQEEHPVLTPDSRPGRRPYASPQVKVVSLRPEERLMTYVLEIRGLLSTLVPLCVDVKVLFS